MAHARYRVQRAEFLGVVPRAFGGRVASYGKWRTVYRGIEVDAREYFEKQRHAPGLFRLRLMHRTTVLDKAR